jgi:hypothetical protein
MNMAKEWQTFVRKFDDMKEGEAELFIKDLTPGPRKYDTRHVIAQVAKKKDALPGGDTLWLRSEAGFIAPEPWYIKVLDELPETVPGGPHEDVLGIIERLQKQRSQDK